MKKLVLFVLSVFLFFGSVNLFAEKNIPDEVYDIVNDVLSAAEKSESLGEGDTVSNGEISFFVPAGWTPVYYNQVVQGMDLLYYVSSENNMANVIIQRMVADTDGLEPSDCIYAILSTLESMYDALEVIGEEDNRVVYSATMGSINIIQDIYCILDESNIYVFSASSTVADYFKNADIFTQIFESVKLAE